jgi:hypothetical protein
MRIIPAFGVTKQEHLKFPVFSEVVTGPEDSFSCALRFIDYQ